MSERDDDPENMPGPAQLRTHARELRKGLTAAKEETAALREELEVYHRRDAFEAVREQMPVEEWGDLRLEDVQDLKVEEITVPSLTVRASERAAQRAELMASAARAAGFDDVVEFEASVKAATEQRAADRASLAVQSAIASGGTAPTSAPPQNPSERAAAAHRFVKETGGPNDDAEAAWIRASKEAQLPKRGGR